MVGVDGYKDRAVPDLAGSNRPTRLASHCAHAREDIHVMSRGDQPRGYVTPALSTSPALERSRARLHYNDSAKVNFAEAKGPGDILTGDVLASYCHCKHKKKPHELPNGNARSDLKYQLHCGASVGFLSPIISTWIPGPMTQTGVSGRISLNCFSTAARVLSSGGFASRTNTKLFMGSPQSLFLLPNDALGVKAG